MEQQYRACPSSICDYFLDRANASGSVFWHVLLNLARFRRFDTIRSRRSLAKKINDRAGTPRRVPQWGFSLPRRAQNFIFSRLVSVPTKAWPRSNSFETSCQEGYGTSH